MELNREQIIKALECCPNCNCIICPYSHAANFDCRDEMMKHALTLIKELTEENEDLNKTISNLLNTIKDIKADGAREIFEEIEPVFMSFCLSLDAYTAWKYLKERYLGECE